MGGFGSGTYLRSGRRRLTSECLALDIDDGEKMDNLGFTVQYQKTSCNFGGKRKWIVCPGEGCGRRVQKLYRWNGVWKCRKCHGLAYQSQLQSKTVNSINKAKKLRMRLGDNEARAMSPIPPKPPRMSKNRYQKIVSVIMQTEIRGFIELYSRLRRGGESKYDWRGESMKEVRNNVESRLSEEQKQVIDMLVGGLSDFEIVRTMGVSLEELRCWRKKDSFFVAELNYRRKLVWENSVDSLRGLIPQALTAIHEVLNDASNSQRWRAAMEIVKVVGLNPEASHDLGRIIGPDEPNEVKQRMY